jgi:hypothetical protein
VCVWHGAFALPRCPHIITALLVFWLSSLDSRIVVMSSTLRWRCVVLVQEASAVVRSAAVFRCGKRLAGYAGGDGGQGGVALREASRQMFTHTPPS